MRLLYFVLKYDPFWFHRFTMAATYTEYFPYDQRFPTILSGKPVKVYTSFRLFLGKVILAATAYDPLATPVFSGRSPSLRVPPPRKTGTIRRMIFHCIVIAYTSLWVDLRRFQGKVGV
jgi:hypothetical protein